MDMLIRKFAVKLAQLSEKYEKNAVSAFENICVGGMGKTVEKVRPLDEISAKYIRAAYAPQLNATTNLQFIPRAFQA